jgi:hypothetical protein
VICGEERLAEPRRGIPADSEEPVSQASLMHMPDPVQGSRTARSPRRLRLTGVKGHRDFPVGGHLISLRADRLCPSARTADLPAGYASGVTPFPAVASARRRLVPSVSMKGTQTVFG